MVIFWSGNWGGRRGGRRPGRRLGPGGYSGHYRGHYGGGGYGGGGYGPPPGYGRYRRRSSGDGSCLRDLLLLNTGCCLANAIGCSAEMLLVAPTTARQIRTAGRGSGRLADRLVAAVRVYQREVSPRRPPCCSFTPTCSAYAVEALETHGARRGSWLALRRLARCHPRAVGGLDQVPAAG